MVVFTGTGRIAAVGLLVLLAGCGARTGALDGEDIYASSSLPGDDAGSGGKGAASSSGATGASSSTGGSHATGTAGSAGQGTGGKTSSGTAGASQAGSPGKGGAPGSTGGAAAGGAATAGAAGSNTSGACSAYCKYALSNPCSPQSTSYAECASGCSAALESNGGKCEAVGSQMLGCFIAALSSQPGSCVDLNGVAETTCAQALAAFQDCSSASGPGDPVPPPQSCSGSGGGDAQHCSANLQCSNGLSYSSVCVASQSGVSYCTCVTGGLTTNLTLNEGINYACNDALATCGAPVAPNE